MGMRVEEKGVARLDAVLATGFSFCPTWSVGKKLVVVVADQGAAAVVFYGLLHLRSLRKPMETKELETGKPMSSFFFGNSQNDGLR